MSAIRSLFLHPSACVETSAGRPKESLYIIAGLPPHEERLEVPAQEAN